MRFYKMLSIQMLFALLFFLIIFNLSYFTLPQPGDRRRDLENKISPEIRARHAAAAAQKEAMKREKESRMLRYKVKTYFQLMILDLFFLFTSKLIAS